MLLIPSSNDWHCARHHDLLLKSDRRGERREKKTRVKSVKWNEIRYYSQLQMKWSAWSNEILSNERDWIKMKDKQIWYNILNCFKKRIISRRELFQIYSRTPWVHFWVIKCKNSHFTLYLSYADFIISFNCYLIKQFVSLTTGNRFKLLLNCLSYELYKMQQKHTYT